MFTTARENVQCRGEGRQERSHVRRSQWRRSVRVDFESCEVRSISAVSALFVPAGHRVNNHNDDNQEYPLPGWYGILNQAIRVLALLPWRRE